MPWLRRLSIRARVTAACAAAMALLLTVIGAWVYWSTSAALLDEIDAGLRFRAAAIASSAQTAVGEAPYPGLQEGSEAFDQLLAVDGRILRSSAGLPAQSLLGRSQLATLREPTFFQRHVPRVEDTARLLAMPVGNSTGGSASRVLVVGTTMADRTDALHHLALVFAVAGPAAAVLASLAGWVVARLGLRPLERMRRQAAAVTASGLDHRLDLPPAEDELRGLGTTLNDMLDRLDAAARRDRRFLARASHELRTPLTALKAELDVAASGPHDVATLSAAIASATEEADRLRRLANDLLALARSHDGRLPVAPDTCRLRSLLEAAAVATRARALRLQVTITVTAPDVDVRVDAMRLRQALDNLLDNALRHTPAGGTIVVSASTTEDELRIVVYDDGPGFPSIERVRTQLARREDDTLAGEGLGLRIARIVASSHGGDLHVGNRDPHGAVVTLTIGKPGLALAQGPTPGRTVDGRGPARGP